MQGTPQDLNFKSLRMDSNVKNSSQSMVPLNEKTCLSRECWLPEEFIFTLAVFIMDKNGWSIGKCILAEFTAFTN
jgi:hypothetical protein